MIEISQTKKWTAGGGTLTVTRKREQLNITFDGWENLDYATVADIRTMRGHVRQAADWIENISTGSAHPWTAKHNIQLPPMWKFMRSWNFGIKTALGYFTAPMFAILSDRDTLPMVELGKFESVLKYYSAP